MVRTKPATSGTRDAKGVRPHMKINKLKYSRFDKIESPLKASRTTKLSQQMITGGCFFCAQTICLRRRGDFDICLFFRARNPFPPRRDSILLYSTNILYSTLLYSTLLYSTISRILYYTILYYTML